jgi:lipoprotein-anchoring transpeptidase ErfK/SrfK
VTATATGEDGQKVTRTATFRTLKPRATNRATLVPGDDWNVGVGMPVIVTFAQAVRNRSDVVKALTVTSTPAVRGAWRWMNDHEVQWRPAKYWPSGTKVSVRAALGGVETSPGVWGRRTVTTAFAVGPAQISTVDVRRHTMTVRRDGKVVRTIPVTTGKRGFLTRNGVKVVMSRESQVRMDAATTGTDPTDPNYYDIQVKWALRLTYSGEFLHAAPWSVGQQGRANVSHGCTGMSTANAKWLYDNSRIGDIVEFTGSRRPLEWGNGYTVWNRPFKEWAAA